MFKNSVIDTGTSNSETTRTAAIQTEYTAQQVNDDNQNKDKGIVMPIKKEPDLTNGNANSRFVGGCIIFGAQHLELGGEYQLDLIFRYCQVWECSKLGVAIFYW